MDDLAGLLERFRRGPELVAAVNTGVANVEADFSPGPGRWTIRQILAHLADSEVVAATRFRWMLAQDNPTILGYDQDAWAEQLDYQRRKPSQSLESFRRMRLENYELLKELPESEFSRVGTHNERGTMTVLDWLRIYAGHPEKHAQQIQTVRQQYKQSRTQGQ